MKHALALLAVLSCAVSTAQAAQLTSPDGRLAVSVSVNDAGTILYHVTRDGKTILADAPLGLVFDRGRLDRDAKLTDTGKVIEHDETWKPVCGERDKVRDHYREQSLIFASTTSPAMTNTLTLRAYDEGVAWRYEVAGGSEAHLITDEITQFRFPHDAPAWAVYTAQGEYERTSLSAIKPGCERPLVVQLDDACYVALAEARLVDYARMKLSPVVGAPLTLVSDLAGHVVIGEHLATPWRVVMVADSPGKLLENNDLIRNLNDPCAVADTSWIKPGKVIREVTLTTDGAKRCVDFAAKHHIAYMLFDAGWYGNEYNPASDATTISVDPERSPGPLDLHDVIDYANQRGVGIILYVNHLALERQLDELLPLYEKWGVKGVKFGFVNVGEQQWTAWLHDAIRKAAAHHLMVDVHDEYRPTGFSRTYPNFMTQEGIGGDETSPSAAQTLTLAFTRLLAGAADNTICYYDPRVDANANHAFQLAKAVCLYSPWQCLYWYDKPAGPGADDKPDGMNHVIGDEPELRFFDEVPTVWDETRVLDGAIGQYALIARRSGTDWYIGAMNGDEPRTFTVKLDMLPAKQTYRMSVYADNDKSGTRTHVSIDRRNVMRDATLTIALKSHDGQAIHLTPAGETDARLQSDGPGWRLQQANIVDPNRPRVLLIGDSIVNGYASPVIAAIGDKAYVDAWINPYCQGSYKLDEMVRDVLAHGPYDVIHFNMGLHGWQKGRIPDGQFIPLTQKLVDTIRAANPNASLIWASSTPVTKKDHPGELEPDINPVIVEHNRMAAQVMTDNHIPIDDLYGLMSTHLDLARGDSFHWTGPGVKLQAEAVTKIILDTLADRAKK